MPEPRRWFPSRGQSPADRSRATFVGFFAIKSTLRRRPVARGHPFKSLSAEHFPVFSRSAVLPDGRPLARLEPKSLDQPSGQASRKAFCPI
jgi:hypothetical protein